MNDDASQNGPNKELNSFLDNISKAGMRITNQWKGMWITALKYAWGQQLQNLENVKTDWNYIVINRIYPLMFQNIAKLAKNHPKVLTFPWSDEKEGVAEFVDKWAGVLQYVWESPYELNMRLKLIYGLLDAALFGYMVGKTYWDPRVRYEQEDKTFIGNVRETFVHPATFWVDPAAEGMNTAENCGTRRRVKVEWAVNRWPKHKEAIEKEGFVSSDAKYSEGDVVLYAHQKASTVDKVKASFSKIVSLIFKQGYQQGQEVGEDVATQKYVWIEEIYWKDYSTKHVKIEDNRDAVALIRDGIITQEDVSGIYLDAKTGKEMQDWPKEVVNEYDEPQFPNGRFVLRIGQTILNPTDEEQRYTGSRWPFTVMPYHILPHMWQGCNAVEMARNNNDILNMTISSLVRRVELAAEPERIVEKGALARDREGNIRQKKPLFGLGKIIITEKGKRDAIKNLDYGRLDPSIMTLAQILKQDIDDAMFMQDVARGATGTKGGMGTKGGKMTATEAARLDTNSHDYVALQAIFLDSFIDNTLTLIAEIVQTNYEPERIVRIIGNDQEKSNYALTAEMLDVRFDVNIEPGSTLPFDEEKKKNDYATAYKILENPMPNPLLDDMLRVLKISNRKKILLKHQGTQLFRQFVMMSQMLKQVPPESIQAALQTIPELQPLYQLLMQASQLQIPMAG